ncbi:hypothetical protein ACI2JA_02155 [Alkalihalobacillus sp. NPDC078783]
MKQLISLFLILCLNSLAFAGVFCVIIAKWSVVDQNTGIVVMVVCFVLGLWNLIAMIDLLRGRQKG